MTMIDLLDIRYVRLGTRNRLQAESFASMFLDSSKSDIGG